MLKNKTKRILAIGTILLGFTSVFGCGNGGGAVTQQVRTYTDEQQARNIYENDVNGGIGRWSEVHVLGHGDDINNATNGLLRLASQNNGELRTEIANILVPTNNSYSDSYRADVVTNWTYWTNGTFNPPQDIIEIRGVACPGQTTSNAKYVALSFTNSSNSAVLSWVMNSCNGPNQTTKLYYDAAEAGASQPDLQPLTTSQYHELLWALSNKAADVIPNIYAGTEPEIIGKFFKKSSELSNLIHSAARTIDDSLVPLPNIEVCNGRDDTGDGLVDYVINKAGKLENLCHNEY